MTLCKLPRCWDLGLGSRSPKSQFTTTPLSAADGGAEYCDERVCLCVCVCLFAIMSSELHVQSSPTFIRVTYSRGSVLLWRRSSLMCYLFPVLWMTSYLRLS